MADNHTVVVTGVNGFVGQHLVRELFARGHRVVGVGRDDVPVDPDHLHDYLQADLRERWPTTADVDAVIHLAGLAAVGPSFRSPDQYVKDNSAMLFRIGEAAIESKVRGRIIVVSTGAVYDAEGGMPLGENSRLGASSPYVISKLLLENIAHYFRSRKIEMVVARPFNHSGPGQKSGFLLPDLFHSVTQAMDRNSPTIEVGNLATRRDYTDVRDVARAYRFLVEAISLRSHTYNVCSGTSTSGRDILGSLLRAIGDPPIAPVVDPGRVRPEDPPSIVGDASRLRRETGWAPSIGFESTIADFVRAASN